ncbi:hypothetical protein FKM82_029102 [Ascaphus truei]
MPWLLVWLLVSPRGEGTLCPAVIHGVNTVGKGGVQRPFPRCSGRPLGSDLLGWKAQGPRGIRRRWRVCPGGRSLTVVLAPRGRGFMLQALEGKRLFM